MHMISTLVYRNIFQRKRNSFQFSKHLPQIPSYLVFRKIQFGILWGDLIRFYEYLWLVFETMEFIISISMPANFDKNIFMQISHCCNQAAKLIDVCR